jgi:CDP-diacylglycerol--serine O-phosphatidyltransferase
VWVCFDNGISGSEVFYGVLKMKWLAWGITLFAGISMVSDLRYYSAKDVNLRHSVPFMAILLIVLSFVLISYSPPEVLFAVSLVYGLSGYGMWVSDKLDQRRLSQDNLPEE